MTTLYRLLGVREGADAAEIKSAYRALARKYHPDHNSGHSLAERRFRLLAEAYEVLSDTERRDKYDKYGKASLAKRSDQPGIVGGMQRLLTNVEQALEARRRGLKKRGEDRRFPLEATLAQAVYGATVAISLTRTGPCDLCRGVGAEPNTSLDVCHVCEGRGSIREGGGLLSTDTVCEFCDGRGKVAPSPCGTCDGAGLRERTLSVPVSIPPNARPGRRLVLRGYGTVGVNGGDSGDLFVELSVATHPLFDREGDDLKCIVPITIAEAVLGGEATVPLLDAGSVTVRVPPGTRSGQQLRLRGRGGPLERGGRGDLLVRLDIETPVVDSSVAREVLGRLEQVSIHPLRAAYRTALLKHLEATEGGGDKGSTSDKGSAG
jgi:molecular chaperone DnaJ